MYSRNTGGKRASKGKVYKGCALFAAQDKIGQQSQHKFTSIPTAYETILNVGEKEKNGFGGRTHRFKSSVNELPGPGYYGGSSDHNISTKKKPSYSKKGAGGISNVGKRWYNLPGPTFNPPGPGSYYAPSFVDESLKKNPNSKHGSAVFAKPQSKTLSLMNPAATITPGPGDYNSHEQTTMRVRDAKPSSMFASKTQRQPRLRSNNTSSAPSHQPNYAMSADVPSSPSRNPSKKKKRVGHHDESLPSSMFRSTSKRAPLSSSIAPGPGYYQADLNTPNQPVTSSSMFANTGKLDRFGKPLVRHTRYQDTPGPGSYVKIDKTKRKKRTHGVFRSKSSRFQPT
eukprot:CAMPEP_0117421492 /NCGR_PEP_ID=MMETSP0758-20121206/2563_1 /TAXON_ID=63605 /ORGANISM="Percolomonas cosmopolitus, Strain AE-1 (ATCC 50343)" /LENGTH=340 /DNA_ID=CAMNT_0005203629 /DNA_START=144 /DNA_END=1162 /DNA_ORIENTATION=-